MIDTWCASSQTRKKFLIQFLKGMAMASFMSKRQIINTEKARVTQVISFSHLRNVYVDPWHSRSALGLRTKPRDAEMENNYVRRNFLFHLDFHSISASRGSGV